MPLVLDDILMMQDAGELNLTHDVAWCKWRSLTGMLFEKKIRERLKSEIYGTIVQSVAIYGAEYRSATMKV